MSAAEPEITILRTASGTEKKGEAPKGTPRHRRAPTEPGRPRSAPERPPVPDGHVRVRSTVNVQGLPRGTEAIVPTDDSWFQALLRNGVLVPVD